MALRRQEIGVRLALGARSGQIVAGVLGQGARLVAVGAATGLLAAWALTRWMSAVLYEVSPTDPLTFTAAPALLALAALAGCYLPARQATNVDPIAVLRRE